MPQKIIYRTECRIVCQDQQRYYRFGSEEEEEEEEEEENEEEGERFKIRLWLRIKADLDIVFAKVYVVMGSVEWYWINYRSFCNKEQYVWFEIHCVMM